MSESPELPASVVVAQGDLNHVKELSRWLGARGIHAELQRPPEQAGAGKG